MAGPVKGDVVVVPFPFSDLTGAKRRPALVLAAPGGNDLILCQITSQAVRDPHAIALTNADFETGSLRRDSNARPNRIFTCDRSLILYKAGSLKQEKMREVVDGAVKILRQ